MNQSWLFGAGGNLGVTLQIGALLILLFCIFIKNLISLNAYVDKRSEIDAYESICR